MQMAAQVDDALLPVVRALRKVPGARTVYALARFRKPG